MQHSKFKTQWTDIETHPYSDLDNNDKFSTLQMGPNIVYLFDQIFFQRTIVPSHFESSNPIICIIFREGCKAQGGRGRENMAQKFQTCQFLWDKREISHV